MFMRAAKRAPQRLQVFKMGLTKTALENDKQTHLFTAKACGGERPLPDVLHSATLVTVVTS